MNIFTTQKDYCNNSRQTSAYNSYGTMNHSGGDNPKPSEFKKELTFSMEGMNTSEGSIPPGLEACRLPSWYAQYIPKESIRDADLMSQAIKETGEIIRMHDRFNSDGRISRNEQRILDNFRNNHMEANQALRDLNKSASNKKHEISEYSKKLSFYFKEAMNEQGITQANYFEKVLQVEGDNENLHQRFKEMLFKDSNILELMDEIGLKRPS